MKGLTARGLYAVTDPNVAADRDLAQAVVAALRGGARLLQYRDKRAAAATRRRRAEALLAICADFGVPLIINDEPELAASVGAHGVHLGREDPDPARARALLGRNAVIGVSCYDDLERARYAFQAGASYVAFGRFFRSSTKPGDARATPALLSRARSELPLPLVAIGGITADNAGPLLDAGADMLAVVRGVFAQADVEAAARRIAALFDR